MKRSRQSGGGGGKGGSGGGGEGGGEGGRECPVCLESVERRTQTKAFQCVHVLCRSCDTRMKAVLDNRCPVCRCPRNGMSREQSEPDPNRNHDAHDVEILLPQEFADAMRQISNQALRFVAGETHDGRRTRAAQVVVHRPGTGHVMFFQHDPPVDAEGLPLLDQSTLVFDESQAQAGGPAGVLNDDQARTFASILGLESAALQALLSIPEISIHQWQVMRSRSTRRRRA